MTTKSNTSSTTSITSTGRRLVQVARNTWEPTLLVWTQIDDATWTSELGIISTTADGFSGVVHNSDVEPVRCWSFARTESALIEIPEPEAEPVITAEIIFTREQGIRLCSVLFDSIGHANQGLKDATHASEIAWWNERIDIAINTHSLISHAISASDSEAH
jgi:hypothetical protein